MSEQNDKGWPRAHFGHSMGKHEIGLELFVEVGRLFTENDQRVIAKAMRDLQEELHAETQRLDPDNAQWKEDWLLKARVAFRRAELEPIYVREIANEYCGAKCCPHRVWLIVTTRLGPIKMGWRKNVINIDWSGSDIQANGTELFASEEVTKGEHHIHAWSYEKATEYLKRLAEQAGTTAGV